MPSNTLLISLALIGALVTPACRADNYSIAVRGSSIHINAGILARTISRDGACLSTRSIRVGGEEMLSGPAREFSATFTHANPNRRPVGLRPGEGASVEQKTGMSGGTDSLDVSVRGEDRQSVEWIDPVTVTGDRFGDISGVASHRVTHPGPGVTRLNVRVGSDGQTLDGVTVDLFYEVYDGFPAVRKWVEIANNGPIWLKVERLAIDDIELSEGFLNRTLLTPEERGACSSIIAFGSADRSRGVIACSEIPSALRSIGARGAMGYADEHFEWVLGPSERFVSEPVFLYAYDGQVTKTISGVSTPLDRTVEREFKWFLERIIGIAADPSSIPAPLWCSWSNFGPLVNDGNMREQADIAAQVGFECLQIDAGWNRSRTKTNWDCAGSEPDTDKFPDFAATSRYIRSRGLQLGIWVSCFRSPDSKDLRTMPDACSLPVIKRGEGVGMSFASAWRDYYANDLVYIHDRYGAAYVKQDLSNIRFGDIAEGHDSRTKKESLLRGLRGLLDAQDTVRRLAPDMTLEITHEIYWGTPGVPADLAALKHAHTYHVPPNDYSGCGHSKQRPNEKWTYDPVKLRDDLIRGCWNARQRFYVHRGLPLYCIEYYGAATVNFRGSLTPEVQDRQVCSWLMGAPSVFAGDLSSLTPENVRRYRQRFDLVKRLQRQYGIYRHFQYSGVPEPTDTDWHWWGKLNDDGCGAVVVIRGSGGSDERRINIPWVTPDRKYRVTALFEGKALGVFTGSQLADGALSLALPPLGQEILDVSAAQ